MDNDSRLRYFYILEINNKIVFKGFLLHEEAWIFLKETTQINKSASIFYDASNTSIKSDQIKL